MKRSVIVITVITLVAAILLFSTVAYATGWVQYWTPYRSQSQGPWYGGGMMGGYGGVATSQGKSLSIQQATQIMQSTPSNAKVIPGNNSIIFDSQDIRVFALAIMPDRAINLTGMQPPSYSKGDVFVIYGLINPVLEFPKGASVNFTIVNLDDDMYHNMAISSISPPYPYMSMQDMMSSNWHVQTGYASFPVLSMMPFLPPADYGQGSAHEYSQTLSFSQQGNLWYLCTYPGHAQSGMYGQIVVTG